MKVKFLNADSFIEVNGYMMEEHRITLVYEGNQENLGGFVLYDDDETIIRSCEDFVYRWDIHESDENSITYTNLEGCVQSEPVENNPIEYVHPLTVEELTPCVADLMFETSLMKLGMEVE